MSEQASPVLPLLKLTPRELAIRSLVASAPPFTADQRDRIRRIVAPVLEEIFTDQGERKSA